MSNSRPTTPVKKSVPPMVAIQLDMSAPTPQPSPRQFAFDVSLLSPQPDDGPTPTFFQHPILATSPPSSPTTAHYAPRPNTAPPAISTFSDVERDDLARPQTAQHQQFQPRRPPATARRASDKFIAPGGELLPPPPPLFRPTTFWRNNRRSGVTGTSYSPGSHVIRRATFIAAGLALDRPGADLSAFGVESRTVHLVLPPDSALTISGSHE